MVPLDYKEAVIYMRDVLKYVAINNGAQYVMIIGTQWMHRLHANSWDFQQEVFLCLVVSTKIASLIVESFPYFFHCKKIEIHD